MVSVIQRSIRPCNPRIISSGPGRTMWAKPGCSPPPPADHFIRPWSDYVGKTGLLGTATRALAAARILPEAFLYGFDYVLFTSKVRAAFLNGAHSITGWRT